MSGEDVKRDKDTTIETRYAALGDRSREHIIRRTELELSEADHELQAREAQLRKEAADDRAVILAAVRTSVPDITAKLVEKMDELAVKDHAFTDRDKTTLMNLANLQIADSQDFFDLNSAQRDDLLDRIGFYRGIAISARAANPVQVGFRDVLKRPGEVDTLWKDDNSTFGKKAPVAVAKPLYRKPSFAGYFENYFTFSEAVHQNQKNGVSNLKFSLSASAGVAVRGGVGIGASYSQQSQIGEGAVGKEIFITSNFFLPKIELSFDDRHPCASSEFVEACEDAIYDDGSDDEKFYALKRVLETFGHFVPTMTLIGGRLFAAESKKYTGVQSTKNTTERFAASVKANLKTVSANAEMEVSAERSEQIQADDQSKDENQASTFHAMGGEGGLVQDAAGWIRSLSDYRRWSAVQRENLIPSLNVLPTALKKDCWSVLKAFVSSRTKRELIFDEDAAFVFYGDYAGELEVLAAETWFTAKNEAHLTALTISDTSPTDGVSIGLADLQPHHLQVWRISPDGHLIAYVTRESRLRGRSPAEFAIALDDFDTKAPPAQISIVLRQLNQSEHQFWDYTGAGNFKCTTIKGNYVLAVNENQQLVARRQSNRVDRGEVWDLSEVELSELTNRAVETANTAASGSFKLCAGNNANVLSVRDAEAGTIIASPDGQDVVMLPDLSGPHQLWTMTSEGYLISSVHAMDGPVRTALFLTADGTDVLKVKTKAAGEHQRWTITSEGFIKSTTKLGKVATAGDVERVSHISYPVRFKEQTSGARQTWKADRGQKDVNSVAALQHSPIIHGGVHQEIFSFSSAPIRVSGHIRGMRLDAYNRGFGRDGWGINCKLFVQGGSTDSSKWVGIDRDLDEDNSAEVSYIRSDKKGACYFENSLLYLPPHAIAEFRFAFAPGSKVLTPMYRTSEKSDWVFSHPTDYSLLPNADNVLVSSEAVVAEIGKTVVAVGLYWDRQNKFLAPRLLLR